MNEKKEPGSLTLILALGITGMLSGIILVGAFLYTDPLIRANKEAAIRTAIFKVLPECKTYKTLELREGGLQEQAALAASGRQENDDTPVVYAGYNDNQELVGFAVPGSEPGFQDVIVSILGYDHKEKRIVGLEILESKETPGLGDKIFKDADFQENFQSLNVEPAIVMVKKGEKTKDNQVDAITGATISSKAVVASLNKSMDQWKKPIEDYATNEK